MFRWKRNLAYTVGTLCLFSHSILAKDLLKYNPGDCRTGPKIGILKSFERDKLWFVAEAVSNGDDIWFLVSDDQDYFYQFYVTNKPESSIRACIVVGGRQADLPMTANYPSISKIFPTNKPRYHIYLAQRSFGDKLPLPEFKVFTAPKYAVLTGFYASNSWLNTYDELVEIKSLGGSYTRGHLTSVPNEMLYKIDKLGYLSEDKTKAIETRKSATTMLEAADHGLPVFMLLAGDDGTWASIMYDRVRKKIHLLAEGT